MVWLVIAILFLLAGHLVKVYRWKLFIELYEKADISVLLKSLSIAHAVNFVIPFHIGDLYRIWYSGKRMVNGIKFSLATVIVEHYIDLIILAIVCAVLYAIGHNTIGTTVLLTTIAVTVVLTTVVSIRWDTKTKNIILWFAGLFNPRIELKILGLVWTFVNIFKKLLHLISKWRVISLTALMWGMYMASYWCFAEALQSEGFAIRLRNVVDIFFNRSSILNARLFEYGGNASFMLLSISVYILTPLLLIYLASFLYELKLKRHGGQTVLSSSVIPHVNSHDALMFLETFFKGNFAGAYMKGFLEVNKDVNILEDYSAGSNAVTLLCTDGMDTFYRKFAIGADGEKLYQQIKWLQGHQADIPLPEIMKVRKEDDFCSYDMAYHEQALNFFTFIHTHAVERSWKVLEQVLDELKDRLYVFDKEAGKNVIDEYIEKKITRNLHAIKKNPIISDLLRYDEIVVNGVRYDNLGRFDSFFEIENLKRIFAHSPVCNIHGDLTIENIICGEEEYYLIDPNTGNILECPYLDFAKLFQSLHGGYEFLMRVRDWSVNGNHINFTYIRSSAYDELYQRLCQYILKNYGEEVLCQVYYHEIVHWLRLMPYKLSHLKQKALVFYAGMIMVMNSQSSDSLSN